MRKITSLIVLLFSFTLIAADGAPVAPTGSDDSAASLLDIDWDSIPWEKMAQEKFDARMANLHKFIDGMDVEDTEKARLKKVLQEPSIQCRMEETYLEDGEKKSNQTPLEMTVSPKLIWFGTLGVYEENNYESTRGKSLVSYNNFKWRLQSGWQYTGFKIFDFKTKALSYGPQPQWNDYLPAEARYPTPNSMRVEMGQNDNIWSYPTTGNPFVDCPNAESCPGVNTYYMVCQRRKEGHYTKADEELFKANGWEPWMADPTPAK